MSRGSGRGFGFVGSTFGETDIVSPYLAMQEQQQEAKPQPIKFEKESIDATQINNTHNQNTEMFLDEYRRISQDPDYMRIKQYGASSEDEYNFYRQKSNQVNDAEAALIRTQKARDESFGVYSKNSELVFNPESNLYLPENQKIKKDFDLGLEVLRQVNSGEIKGSKPMIEGNNSYIFIPEEELSNPDVYDLFNIEEMDYVEVDGGLAVNATAYPFSIDEGMFKDAERYADVLGGINLPMVQSGYVSDDGNTYEGRDGTSVDVAMLKSAIAQRVFLGGLGENISIKNKGGHELLKGGVYQLTPTAKSFALSLGIEPQQDGSYTKEDADKVFQGMFDYRINQSSVKTKRVDKVRTERGGRGDAVEFAPVGVEEMVRFGFVEPYTTEGGRTKYQTLGDVELTNAVALRGKSNNYNLADLGLGKMNISNVGVDINDNVYIQGVITKQDKDTIDKMTGNDVTASIYDSSAISFNAQPTETSQNYKVSRVSTLAVKFGYNSAQELIQAIKQGTLSRSGGEAAPAQDAEVDDDDFDFSQD